MDDGTLDADTAFDLLSNERRRKLLCLLAQSGEEVPLQAAARQILRVDDGEGELSEKQYKSVYISLYQNHAPRLADAGVIHYDEDERTVALVHGERTRELLQLLDSEPANPWYSAYLSVALLAVVVGLLVSLGVFPTIEPVWLVPGLVLCLGLGAIGAHQYYARERVLVDDCNAMEQTARAPDGIDPE